MKKNFKIYQVNDEKENARYIMFSGLDMLEHLELRDKLSLNLYNKVWEGSVEAEEGKSIITILDHIYMKFQSPRLEGYKGHSLSVSDIVEIDGKYYYCDSYGWEEITFPTEEEHEVTLYSGHIHFAQNGDLLHGSIKIGTWEKEDVWAKNGGRHYDKSGNRLVPFIYWVTIISKDFCNTAHAQVPIPYYSRKEVREHLDGKKVTVTIQRAA